ncbi:MAG: PAS domain S-box protein [Acidobacteria bacterium]|nr:PAS domain S-box protein [Acidobacteriota bacterium]
MENQFTGKQIPAVSRHTAEERFHLLVDAVQDYAIYMLDCKGNIISWNAGAERIKGYKEVEIVGQHFSLFFTEEDNNRRKPGFELEMASRHGRFEGEGWRVRKDGTRFWANVTITAVRDANGELIGYAKVTRDITDRMQAQTSLEREISERRQAEERLLRSETALRELSLHLLKSQDEERRRVGRELHDSLGQLLAALKMKLEMAARHQLDGSAIMECAGLADSAITEIRTMSYLLYPPMLEEKGLQSAMRWYVDGFAARSGIDTTVDVQDSFRLPREVEVAMFRVLQEALTNVHRHSGSKFAHVRLLQTDKAVTLEVADHGRGISSKPLASGPDRSESLGVGLRGMRERMAELGGKLELASTEQGTTVRAFVPSSQAHRIE